MELHISNVDNITLNVHIGHRIFEETFSYVSQHGL